MKNRKNTHISLSSYCKEYISNFNLHQLNASLKRNSLKAAAIAATSASFALSSGNANAQVFDCPPVFDRILPTGGSVINPNGLTSTTRSRSKTTLVDYDGDGDFDVISGDSDFGTSSGSIYLYRNNGTNAAPNWAAPLINPDGLVVAGSSNIAPAFVDIDGDGDLDAFVGETFGGLTYYENTGSATAPNYVNQGDPLGINAFAGTLFVTDPTFADIDNDGDQDLFVGDYFGNVLYLENGGNSTTPSFTGAVNNPFGITGVDYYSAPVLGDLDGDGDLDMMVGEFYNGEFLYFENTGTSSAPSFAAPVTNPFFLTSAFYTSTPAFADIDNDGDLDLFSGNVLGQHAYYENLGDAQNPKFLQRPFDISLLPSGYNALDYADMDNDGDIDLMVGNDNTSGSIFYLENTANAATGASFAAPVFVLTNGGFEAHPTLADLDGDGDIDMLVENFSAAGNFNYYENTGTPTNFVFGAPQINPFGLSNGGLNVRAPQFMDLDGDGDQDVMAGLNTANVLYFENTGTASAPAYAAPVTNPFGITGLGTSPQLSEVDIDGDGDLDLAYADDTSTKFYINTGTTTAPSFVDSGINGGIDDGLSDQYSIKVVDIDRDGKFEAFVGNRTTEIFVYKDNKVLPVISINETDPVFSCEANTLSVSSSNFALSDLTVTWYDANNNVVGQGATFTLSSLASTTYSAVAKVTATGCESNQPTISVVQRLPVISIVEGSTINSCETTTLTATSTTSIYANNDLTFTWYNSAGTQVGIGTSFTIPSLDSESYSVKATTVTGCESNQPSVNVVKGTPVISVVEGTRVDACTVATLTAASSNFAVADLTFEWLDPNNNVVGTGSTLATASLAPQTYTLKATSVTGCESTTTVDVVRTLPDISVAEGATVNSCAVNTVSVVSSNYSLSDLTFEWLVNGNVVGTGVTYTLPTTDSKVYTVRATTSNGCQSTASITALPDLPNISVAEGVSVFSCEPVTLNVKSSDYLLSDLNFTWLDSDGNAIGTGTSIEVDPLALPNFGPKTVTVSATSPTGCVSNVVSVTVACSDEVAINLSATAGYNTANLTWTTTGTRPVREYEVYADPGQFGTYFLFGYSSTTSYEAVGLTNGQKVDFKVRPIYVDGDYGTYSNVATVKPSIVLGEEDNEKAGFAFFPNPNNGEFNLRLQDGSTAASVSVVNLSGQEVFTTTLNSSQTSINLGNVASGMYIVRVKTEQGIYQQKVSVVR